MKYMLLMQFSAAGADFPRIDTWTPEEIQAHIGFMGGSTRSSPPTGSGSRGGPRRPAAGPHRPRR